MAGASEKQRQATARILGLPTKDLPHTQCDHQPRDDIRTHFPQTNYSAVLETLSGVYYICIMESYIVSSQITAFRYVDLRSNIR